jgi:hypothetical protein
LEERKAKRLCFNCDIKYNKGHKCGEKKLFYIDCEEEEEQEQEPSQDENVEAILSQELTVGYVLYSLHVCVCGCVRYDDCV